MPKLYSSKEIQSALNQMGFNFISQKGFHGKLKNQDGNVVILPINKKEIPQGTLSSILRQAGITLKQLKEAIEK